jgi:hypothetical protein
LTDLEALEIGDDFFRVLARFDIGVGDEDLAVGRDEIGDPLRQRDHRSSGADRLGEGLVAIRQEPERQFVLLGPFPVVLGFVEADTNDIDPASLEIGPAVPQLVGFQRSTTGVGLGIEKEQIGVALQIGARHVRAVVGGKIECGEWLSGFEHGFFFSSNDSGGGDEERRREGDGKSVCEFHDIRINPKFG